MRYAIYEVEVIRTSEPRPSWTDRAALYREYMERKREEFNARETVFYAGRDAGAQYQMRMLWSWN